MLFAILPEAYAWLEPVILVSLIVFIVDLIGNSISFGNKIINALVTAIIFGGITAALVHYKLITLTQLIITGSGAGG